MQILFALRTLFAYLVLGLLLIGVDVPIPSADSVLDALFKVEFSLAFYWIDSRWFVSLFFASLFVGAWVRGQIGLWCKSVLYSFDCMIATICHGTRNRSISGLAGENALNGSLRWTVIAKVIDIIFWFEPSHCLKTYQWEKSKGFLGH